MDQEPKRARFPMVLKLMAGMVLGVLLGVVLGPRAERLGAIGVVVIDLLKCFAGPLLFFAVVDAFLRSEVKLRNASTMIVIAGINGMVAIGIGLALSNVIKPGRHAMRLVASSVNDPTRLSQGGVGEGSRQEGRSLDFIRELSNYFPKNLVQPFLDNSVISIVILAVIVGLSLRKVRQVQVRQGNSDFVGFEALVGTGLQVVSTILNGVIGLLPFAIVGVVARTVGRDGFAPFRALAWYVGTIVLGLAIQILIVYQAWIVLVARRSLGWFWGGARDAVAYALGASSSLVTLPVTLSCLDRIKISESSARLAACVGTNLNNDGILLYEAAAVLFVAQAYGIELSLSQQVIAAGSCAIAGVGIAGIPEAGLISLTLVLTTVGLPNELVPVLLTVDWILSRCRAATNVTSDILIAVLLDRFAGDSQEEADPRIGNTEAAAAP